MTSGSVDEQLAELLVREQAPLSVEGVRECERAYERLLADHPYDAATLTQRNRFRLRHAEAVTQRPRVLLAPLDRDADEVPGPDAWLPLLRVADVVRLDLGPAIPALDRVILAAPEEPFDELLARLPVRPDCFLALGTGAGRWVPVGIEAAPFPTVADFDGVAGLGDRRVIERYDVLVPSTERARELAESLADKDVYTWPGGLAEGSLHHAVPSGGPHAERDIDVSVTFDETGATADESEIRARVLAALDTLESEGGGADRVLVRHGAPRAQYLDLLRRSRISVDVHDGRVPSRRAREIVASGALLVSVSAQGTWGPSGLEPGRHFLAPPVDKVVDALAHALGGGLDVERTARAASAEMRENVSFEQRFARLFAAVTAGGGATRRRLQRIAGAAA